MEMDQDEANDTLKAAAKKKGLAVEEHGRFEWIVKKGGTILGRIILDENQFEDDDDDIVLETAYWDVVKGEELDGYENLLDFDSLSEALAALSPNLHSETATVTFFFKSRDDAKRFHENRGTFEKSLLDLVKQSRETLGFHEANTPGGSVVSKKKAEKPKGKASGKARPKAKKR